MPLNASSMLAANQPQTPNGVALNASAMLGLPGLGNNLQDDMKDQMDERKKKLLVIGNDQPGPRGSSPLDAASLIFPAMK
jgi:hypothetical protein